MIFFKSFCFKNWYVGRLPMDRLGYIDSTMVRKTDYAKVKFWYDSGFSNGQRMMLILDLFDNF